MHCTWQHHSNNPIIFNKKNTNLSFGAFIIIMIIFLFHVFFHSQLVVFLFCSRGLDFGKNVLSVYCLDIKKKKRLTLFFFTPITMIFGRITCQIIVILSNFLFLNLYFKFLSNTCIMFDFKKVRKEINKEKTYQ